DLARLARNNLAFHLGNDECYQRGLDDILAKGGLIRLIEGEGRTNAESRTPFALDALIRGLTVEENGVERKLTDADWLRLLELGKKDPAPMVALMEKLFMELLQLAGVDVSKVPDMVLVQEPRRT